MKKKSSCDFNLVQQDEGNDPSKILDHLLACEECRDHFIQFGKNVKNQSLTRQNFSQENSRQPAHLSPNQIENEEIRDLISAKQVEYLSNAGNMEPTPDYLKKLVLKELSSGRKNQIARFLVKIQEKIEIISGNLEDLVILPPIHSTIFTRSSNQGNQATFINLEQKISPSERITYQIIKDGPESIMLTINLSEFSTMPLSLGLRLDNKMVTSRPVNTYFVHFDHLGKGDYEIEVSFDNAREPLQIPVSIV